MRHLGFLQVFLSVSEYLGRPDAKPAGLEPGRAKLQPKARSESKFLIACGGQETSRFILTDGRTGDPIAIPGAKRSLLKPFAEQLGRYLTVPGISSPAVSRPAILVRGIETVNECGGPHALE